MATFELLIKNGTILDGVTGQAYQADVGIVGQEIKAVGKLGVARARQTILADTKYVAPGFIDIQNHSDSYFTILEIPTQDSLLTQGITTIAVGHCGTSLAPLSHPEALKSVQKWHSLAGANVNWLTFAEYLQALGNYPLGVNVLSLVGHSTLRRGLLRDEIRPATQEEIKIMEKLLADSLAEGAGGVSLGLVYAHEVDASHEELVSVARVIAGQNRLLSVHLRSEGAHVPEALTEVLALAPDALSAKFKISHFKIRGQSNWRLLEEALAVMDRAYQRGTDIFFDVYPYTTSWNVLYTYLPKWAYQGGRTAVLQNLKNPSMRQKILANLRDQNQNLGSIFIANSETNPAFVGKTLAQVAANQEVSVEEALLNVLAATGTQVIGFDHNLSEEVLDVLLKHPLSVIATDGAGYDFNFSPAHGLVHPRCFGAFPKFLSMVRERKLMSWEAAIRKITARPAEKLGLKNRGTLKVGSFADVVVFDPRAVGSRASYENPYQQAQGIDYVVVNGKLAYNSREDLRQLAGAVLQI